jgi:hypothetical protein
MFTKSGIIELHTTIHERLDLHLSHVATVPDNLHDKQISGFGHLSIWKQLVHILTCEEGWIHDLLSGAAKCLLKIKPNLTKAKIHRIVKASHVRPGGGSRGYNLVPTAIYCSANSLNHFLRRYGTAGIDLYRLAATDWMDLYMRNTNVNH